MVSSASVEYAQAQHGFWWWLAWRHFQHILVALFIACLVFAIPLRLWYQTVPLLLPLGLIALLLVLVPEIGTQVNGSRRWLQFGHTTVQPSELIKIFSVLYLARFLSDESTLRHTNHHLRRSATPIAVFGVLFVLLLSEPDMGTVVLLLCCGLLMLFLAGLRLWVCAMLGTGFGFLCASLIVFSPYRWQRIVTFINPWQDASGAGYQLSHALSAFGSGQWFGVGLGHSMEKQFYLPAAHTDFIFAVIAEEFGWLGVLFVIMLFCYLVARMWRTADIARRFNRPFVMYAIYGLSLLMALQVFINLGVNLGMLPTKGITLPFISYGGSSLVSNCMISALVLRAHWELLRDTKPEQQHIY